MTLTDDLIERTEQFVKNMMKDYDPVHDFNHVKRVRNLANKLSDPAANSILVNLGALLHTLQNVTPQICVKDDEFYTCPADSRVEEFLLDNGCSSKLAHQVQLICSNSKRDFRAKEIPTLELNAVADADRLDALGAIGILRACQSGCVENLRPLLAHFDREGVCVDGWIKTFKGRDLARERVKFLAGFLAQFDAEMAEAHDN